MSTAKKGDKVKVHYTGKLTDGTVFDSSLEREPIEFELGAGQMIAGFDKAVDGMAVGDKKTADIPSAEAYGDKRDDMMVPVPHDKVPEEIKPEVGMQLSMQQPDGQSLPVLVAEVNDDHIVLDANHPLAGKDLNFEIELVEIS